MTGDTKGVELREISDDEVERAVSVWLESGLPIKSQGRDTIGNLRRLREADPELFIGAFEEGRMIGVILGTDDRRKGYVNRLSVLPDRRGSGIAKMLVERCESIFRARGRQVICTMIEEYNDESKALFTNIGYKREDEIVYYTKREAEDV